MDSFGGHHFSSYRHVSSRWWQLKYFWNFHPENWGFMIQFDEHIFQMGWFNHQLVVDPGVYQKSIHVDRLQITPVGWVFRFHDTGVQSSMYPGLLGAPFLVLGCPVGS